MAVFVCLIVCFTIITDLIDVWNTKKKTEKDSVYVIYATIITRTRVEKWSWVRSRLGIEASWHLVAAVGYEVIQDPERYEATRNVTKKIDVDEYEAIRNDRIYTNTTGATLLTITITKRRPLKRYKNSLFPK